MTGHPLAPLLPAASLANGTRASLLTPWLLLLLLLQGQFANVVDAMATRTLATNAPAVGPRTAIANSKTAAAVTTSAAANAAKGDNNYSRQMAPTHMC